MLLDFIVPRSFSTPAMAVFLDRVAGAENFIAKSNNVVIIEDTGTSRVLIFTVRPTWWFRRRPLIKLTLCSMLFSRHWQVVWKLEAYGRWKHSGGGGWPVQDRVEGTLSITLMDGCSLLLLSYCSDVSSTSFTTAVSLQSGKFRNASILTQLFLRTTSNRTDQFDLLGRWHLVGTNLLQDHTTYSSSKGWNYLTKLSL